MTTPTVNATGQSGRSYTLYKYALGTTFKSVGGIYVVVRDLAPLYVGQTDDLSTRFGSHHKEQTWLRHNANAICVMAESDVQRRLWIERDLLANYDCPCNG